MRPTPTPGPFALPARPARAGASDRRAPIAGGALRLVHLTTVPQTLLFLRGQVGYLRAHGVEVSAISSPGPELRTFAAEADAVVPVPMERRITPGHDLVALARIFATLRRIRPHIVDAHTPKAGLLGMLAAWMAGVPVRVYHVHGLRYVTAKGLQRRVLMSTEWLAAALSTRVLAVSHSVADVAVRARLVPREKIAVLLGGSINGVDAAVRFRPPVGEDGRAAARAALGLPPDALVIGFVGRLAREKGLGELATAWSTLREALPRARLVLVGPEEPNDPPPPAALEALRADPRVSFSGMDWDTPKYYRAMDVLALPTYREGFPVVPLEAAACGVPVVATRVPGCVDAVVDGETGTLVPPRDPGALAAALRAYLEDPALRDRHGAAARARVLRDYEQRRIWRAVHAEYVRLWSAHAHRSGDRPRRAAH